MAEDNKSNSIFDTSSIKEYPAIEKLKGKVEIPESLQRIIDSSVKKPTELKETEDGLDKPDYLEAFEKVAASNHGLIKKANSGDPAAEEELDFAIRAEKITRAKDYFETEYGSHFTKEETNNESKKSKEKTKSKKRKEEDLKRRKENIPKDIVKKAVAIIMATVMGGSLIGYAGKRIYDHSINSKTYDMIIEDIDKQMTEYLNNLGINNNNLIERIKNGDAKLNDDLMYPLFVFCNCDLNVMDVAAQSLGFDDFKTYLHAKGYLSKEEMQTADVYKSFYDTWVNYQKNEYVVPYTDSAREAVKGNGEFKGVEINFGEGIKK